MRAALVVVLLAAACASRGPRPAYPWRYSNVTSYAVVANKMTPRGVRYGGTTDPKFPAFLDATTAAVAACLAAAPEPTEREKILMDCPLGALRRDVDVSAYDVFVAPDWKASCRDPKEQVFPCRVDPQGCLDKKELPAPTSECPCSCRATIQDNRHVIVTPNLKIYPGELVRLVTSCNLPWVVDSRPSPLSACLIPPEAP